MSPRNCYSWKNSSTISQCRGVKKLIRPDYASQLAEKVHGKAVIRFETTPGHPAQVDWKDAGPTENNRESAPSPMDHATALARHVLAFPHFGTIRHERLVDDLKAMLPLPEPFVTQKETL